MMIKWGFNRGIYNPCLYHHPRLNLRTLVHGDDFVTVGERQSVDEFHRKLKKRFEIKTCCIGRCTTQTTDGNGTGSALTGPSSAEAPVVSEGRLLNRIVSVTDEGWELEADQRRKSLSPDPVCRWWLDGTECRKRQHLLKVLLGGTAELPSLKTQRGPSRPRCEARGGGSPFLLPALCHFPVFSDVVVNEI